jgi:hypothetical protein
VTERKKFPISELDHVVQSRAMLGSRFSAYLNALGIDVWIPRDERSEQASQYDAAVVDVKTPMEAFSVRGFRLGAVLALIDESVWVHRRFFLDVAWAMNEFKKSEREDMSFDWPQPSVGGTDSAGRAFRSFLESQSGGEMRLLMVGGRVAKLAGADIDNTRHVYLDGPLRGGTEKKQLWQQILNMR